MNAVLFVPVFVAGFGLGMIFAYWREDAGRAVGEGETP